MTVVPQNHEPSVELDLGAFTRRLNSGLIVPQADEETTAPIDIVDRQPGTPMPRPRPPVHPTAAISPLPQPTPPLPMSTSDTEDGPRATPKPAKVTESAVADEPREPQRRVRDALIDWIDARAAARTKKVAEDDPITTGAFVVICLMTLLVAGLAFALSFDMMYAAAKHYGWGARMATLFPLIIDVGAIGGTFMGAISANSTYRRIGHQVLVVTLAASVLFNLVGHDIKGTAPDLLGAKLPERYAWTGTVAAILVPLLLAYFVHALSKALKTFTDQKRLAKIAKEEEQRREQQRLERRRPLAAEQPVAPVAASAPVAAKVPVAKAPAARAAAKPGDGRATKADALRIGVRQRASTPANLRKALTGAGYTLPASSTTVENWCKEIKAELAKIKA